MKAVNLIPSGERTGAASLAGSSEGGAFIVVGLMAGLAVLALLYGIAHHQISSRTGQASTLAAEASAAQAQAGQLAPYTSFVAMRNQRAEAINQLVESRFDWAHAFHELGRVLPYDVSLSSVHGSIATSTPMTTTTTTSTSTSTSGSASTSAAAPAAATTPSAAIASATPPGTTPVFTIVGCATSQAEVAETLDRLRLIDGVTDVELQSSTKSESGGGSSSSSQGNCPAPNDPSFTMTVTFSALPAAPAASTAAAPSSTETTSTVTTQTTTGTGGGS